MAPVSEMSDKKTKATIPSYTLESAHELAKLRTSHPVSGGFFSNMDAPPVSNQRPVGRVFSTVRGPAVRR